MMMMIRTQTWLCLGVSGVELMECYGTPYLEKEHPPFLDALPMENFVYLKFPRYLWQHVFFCRKTYQVHHFFREKVGCPHIAIFLVKSMVFGVAFLFWVNTPSLGHESSSFLPSSWERFFFFELPKNFQDQQHLGDPSAKHGRFLHARPMRFSPACSRCSWTFGPIPYRMRSGRINVVGIFPKLNIETGTSWDSVINLMRKWGLKQHFLRIFLGDLTIRVAGSPLSGHCPVLTHQESQNLSTDSFLHSFFFQEPQMNVLVFLNLGWLTSNHFHISFTPVFLVDSG